MGLSESRRRLLGRLRSRRGRPKEGLVLVEGTRAITTALSAGARIRFLVAEVGVGLPDRFQSGTAELEVVQVESGEFAELSDTETPQGILAVFQEPEGLLPSSPSSRVLVLDRIQDPGNAGTLVRSAAAFAIDGVVALDGTVDPWNPKAVRASAGEAFRIPLVRMDWEAFREWRREADVPLLVADAGGGDVRSFPPPPGGWALLLGNEGAGPRREALEESDLQVALPLAPGVESLNAAMAGSILLWTLGPGRIPAGRNEPSSTGPYPSIPSHPGSGRTLE